MDCSKAMAATDGTLRDGIAGYAVVINGHPIIRRTVGAQTSYNAEVQAIDAALEIGSEVPDLWIVVDNKAGAKQARAFIKGKRTINQDPQKEVQKRIRRKLERRNKEQKTTRVTWIPSHWEDKIKEDPQKWTPIINEKISKYKENIHKE
jgi:ribonuclease HI